MPEHITPEQQILILNRTLAGRPLMQCLQHLTTCAVCREQVNQQRGQRMNLTGDLTELPTHLAYEQLAAYVTGTTDEFSREILDNHLASCDFCAGEVQALTTLHTELRQLREPAISSQTAPTTAWWASFKQRWLTAPATQPWASPYLAFATGTLLLLVTLSGWWWWRDQHQSVTQIENAQVTQPAALPAPSASLPSTTAPQTLNENKDLLALLDHGQRISLRQDGRLNTSLALPTDYETALKTTLASQRLSLPEQLNRLAPPPSTLKSAVPESQSFQVLAPLGQVLQSARPVFRWQAEPGASEYVVAVFDEDFQQVLASGPVKQTTWQATRPLERGRIYLWQVTAKVGDEQITTPLAPAPEARFQVLSQAQLNELEQARNAYGQSHLVLGVLYAQAGLLEDSERELQALQRENPQAPLVGRLLQQLRRTPGRTR